MTYLRYKGPPFAFVTDGGVHAPPTTGAYAYSPPYGTFNPGQTGFPVIGAAYKDPVFGTTIRRLTNTQFAMCQSDLYPKNGWWNADASYLVYSLADGSMAAMSATGGGAKQLTNPGGTTRPDAYCSPILPDVFRYSTGTTIKEQSISTGTITTLKDFGVALGACGGSANLVDLNDRYMIVNLGSPSFQVWDKQTDTLFSGAVTLAIDSGYVAMAPDASCLIHVNGVNKRRFAIDLSAKTLATTSNTFHARGGDHGSVIEATDGNVYFIRCDNDQITYPNAVMLRINVATGVETVFYTIPNPDYWTAQPNHIGNVSRGPLQNWIVCSSDLEGGPTYASDAFDGAAPVASWGAMQNEVYMLNVLTGARRRLAHTRNRDANLYYRYQPRACPSWSGERVAFDSNMGVKSNPVGYADCYSIDIPAT